MQDASALATGCERRLEPGLPPTAPALRERKRAVMADTGVKPGSRIAEALTYIITPETRIGGPVAPRDEQILLYAGRFAELAARPVTDFDGK